ncbi:MAG: MFS transporter, partial [Nitratireductor sp.]|nr:MFS transporter [Nitratireductor sp.]
MPSRAILVVLATVVINMTGVGLVWPILPKLVEELSAGSISHVAITYGSIAVIFSVMQFAFGPVFGAMSDRFGRRPVMLVALAGLGLDNLLLAMAPNLGWIFVGRALGGVFGSTFSVANAYMADVSTGKDRAAAFGMVGAAFGVGFVIGPAIGGLLGELDLRLPFWFAAGFSFLNLAFGWLFLEETLPAEKRRPL